MRRSGRSSGSSSTADAARWVRPGLAVQAADGSPGLAEQARQLAGNLGLPLLPPAGPSADRPVTGEAELLLTVTPGRVELRQPGSRQRPLAADFARPAFLRRLRQTGRRSLLGRAVGLGRGMRTVLDATAGLGTDAMLLAGMGLRVVALERDPVVHALLADGLRRAAGVPALEEARARLRAVQGEASRRLSARGAAPDVVYLDPMFPVRRGSALPPGELQRLARLVGPGDAAEARQLLRASLGGGSRRVVVKRPDDGPPLTAPGGLGPDIQFPGKTVRFDVYLARR